MKTYSIALVTGTSSGIGEAPARLLAAEGSGLILVVRSEVNLHALATGLAERHNIHMEVIVADLPQRGQRGGFGRKPRHVGWPWIC